MKSPSTLPSSSDGGSSHPGSAHRPFVLWATALLVFDIAVTLVFARTQSSSVSAAWASGITIAIAAAAVGALLGLIFGVPRALAQNNDASTVGYVTNSNLVDVSDWLTKILLGAGLTQLGRIPEAFSALGDYLAPSLGGGTNAAPFAVALVTGNVVLGFMFGYLGAALMLGAALRHSDELSQARALAQEKSAVTGQINQLDPAPPSGDPLAVEKVEPSASQRRALEGLAQQMLDVETKTPDAAFTPDDYRRVATELTRNELYTPAVNVLIEAAARYPEDPDPLVYAGAILAKYLHDSQGAEVLYFQALQRRPNYAKAYYNLACNEARRRHHDKVGGYLRLALANDPDVATFARQDSVWEEYRDADGNNYLDASGVPKLPAAGEA